MAEGKIVIELTAKGDKFTADIGKATKALDSMKSSLSLIKFDALTNLGQKAYQVAQQIYAFGRNVASSLNDIQRQSSMLGMSTDQFQKFSYIAKMADIEVGDFMTSMKFLANNMETAKKGTGDASNTFKQLGLSVVDTSGKTKSFETMLREIVIEFSKYADGADKAAALNNIFGRSGYSLTQFVNMGAKGMDALIKKFDEYGLKIDKDVILAGSKAEDSFKNFEKAIERLKVASMPLISIFTRIIDLLGQMATKAAEASEKIGKVWGQPEVDLLTGERIEPENRIGWKDPWGREQTTGGKKLFPPQPKPEDWSESRKMAELLGKGWMEAYVNGLEVEYSKVEEVYVKVAEGVFKLRQKIVPAFGIPGTEGWTTGMSKESMDALLETLRQIDQTKEDAWSYVGITESDEALKQYNEDLKVTQQLFDSQIETLKELEKLTEEAWSFVGVTETDEHLKKWKETQDKMQVIGDNIKGIWLNHIDAMLKGTESFAEGVKGIFSDMASMVIKKIEEMLVNWLIFGNMTGIYGSGTGLLGKVGALIGLQEGALVTKPTIAMIGEKGPEYVIPAEKMGQTGNQNYITILAVDSKSFADMVERNPASILKVVGNDARAAGGMRSTIRAYG